MPRFAFGKRRSTAEGDNEVPLPSFRVLDRSEVNDGVGKTFDGGARLSMKQSGLPRNAAADHTYEDDLFAEFKPNTTNRGSGSSNTTKTNSTDNSSRHSNASTAPSSADLSSHEDWKLHKKSHTEALGTATARPVSFLKSGRSWSFGGSKKHQPPTSVGEEQVPDTPEVPAHYRAGRARATTASTDATDTTITPINKEEQDLGLDLGGSFSKMLFGSDKRNSAMALRDENGRQVLQPSAMTGGRINVPSPIHVDRSVHVEPPPHSWASHRSNEDLLGANENTPPPVPKHDPPQIRPRGPNAAASDSLLKRTSAMFGGRRKSVLALDAENEGDDLDSSLLAVSRFMSSDANSRSTTPVEAIGGRQRNPNDAAAGYTIVPRKSPPTKDDSEDDNMFDNIPLNSDRLVTPRQPQRKAPSVPTQAKVMTPGEFEKYRKDKEVASRRAQVDRIRDNVVDDEEEEDDDNYDDDEDEVEKSRQLAKQRRKQEAHMSVYRQQMMKVTGDNEPRPSFGHSFSSPNLTVPDFSRNTSSTTSDAEDDEEVPLAILAAHGFPNKNRPPTRLNQMSSNPNLRQATQPSFQRTGSETGPMPSGGALPPFARNLPTDPYGLVNPTVRESFHLGGGMPAGSAAGQNPPTPTATSHVGLVGVIANEEQQRRLRRGSPQVQSGEGFPTGPGGFDPNHGFPQQMMYPQAMQAQMQQMQHMQMQTQQAMMTPGEQAQIQLSQQMSQFMQMQMQLMQMMAGQQSAGLDPPRSAGHMQSQSLGNFDGMNGNPAMGMNPGVRSSFLDPQMMDTRGDGRTMSLVQPSSSSWLQPPSAPAAGYAGSIRGGQGYAPSIAPSERSNVGLPGRYRPVSHMPPPAATTPDQSRKTYLSSPLSGNLTPRAADNTVRLVSTKDDADDDDDEGWAAMKARREQKKSSWRVRKAVAPNDLDIGSLIT